MIKGTIINRKDISEKQVMIEIETFFEGNYDSEWFGCFDKKLFDNLNIGNVIEFEYIERKANNTTYKNLTSAGLVTSLPKEAEATPIASALYSDKERMAFGNCLNVASRMYGGASIYKLFDIAESIYNEGQKRGRW